MIGTIDLIDAENELVAGIKFDALKLDGYDDAQRNGEAVVALMKSLRERQAIPEIRARYFGDPALNAGSRGRSIRDLFARNGVTGEEIYRHPHFLPYLWYLIHGASLPLAVIAAFVAELADRGHITSSDVVPLGKFARQQARQHRLEGRRAAEEFYRLALDWGLGPSYAGSIRDAVKTLR